MRYFRLHPWAFLVRGIKKSLIINSEQGSVFWVENEVADIIYKAELNYEMDSEELKVCKKLERENLGSLYPTKIAIDKLRIFNIFNERKFHKNTPMIEVAILHLTNKCDLNCDDCNSRFCCSCVKFDSSNDMDVDTWDGIINDLMKLGLKGVVFTGGEPLLYDGFNELCEKTLEKGLGVVIHTHGLVPFKSEIVDRVSILVSVFDEKNFGEIVDEIKDKNQCSILNLTKQMLPNSSKTIVKNISDEMTKEKIKPLTLTEYYVRKTYDACLRNKIYISNSGDVYPCFQHREIVGNLAVTPLYIVLKRLVEDYWKHSVDTWDDCNMCEFRYNCTKCRFLSAKIKCRYNKEETKWY